MKKIVYFLLALLSSVNLLAQGEDFAGATPFTVTCLASYGATGCGGTVYNLGTTTSTQLPANGTMSNDVWFKFNVPAELVKIKVCDPTFDAAIEIWSNSSTMLSAANITPNTGATGKEYMCVGGLTLNGEYYVRVGRVSGSGAGTFSLRVEHNVTELRDQYSPLFPATGGDICYRPGLNVKRTNPCVLPVTTTRWKFVDSNGNVIVCVGQGDQPIASCGEFCLTGETYMVSCEVRGNDAECGNIYWGYGPAKPIQMCSSFCMNISEPANNAILSNFTNTNFSAQFTGYQYQWRFTTDGGATQFCTAWLDNPSNTPTTMGIANCMTFNKIYQVQLRVKLCDSEPDPEWCSPITVTTAPLPYITVQSGVCCLWRNKNGGTINANAVTGVNQYRWRFTPVNPCSSTPLTPIGPACLTSWGTSSTNYPNGLTCITPGTTYIVQVQGRQLASTCSSSCGTSNVAGQQTDWGPACMVAFRTTSSPAVGTPIGCYCTPGMIANEDIPDNPFGTIQDFTAARENEVLHTSLDESQILQIDISETSLEGQGTVEIIALNGAVVARYDVQEMGTYMQFKFTIEEKLSAGIYVVNVSDDLHNVTSKLLIARD